MWRVASWSVPLLFAFSSANGFVKHPLAANVILVDKKSNKLKLAEYEDNRYKVIKEYHTTVGRVRGDKTDEGDLKTPEGIYTFNAYLTPPGLKKKFGDMAFYMDYPNRFDKLAGATGFDIMLHATDTPERLKKDFDSKGCIVVNNHEIRELKKYIKVGLTPILVFDELKGEYMKPGGDARVRKFFADWVNSWEARDIDRYVNHYHSAFKSAKGMGLAEFKKYKRNLNRAYKKIVVNPENVQYYRHPKYTMIKFIQNYRSVLRNGRAGHRSRGTKTIYVAEEAGQLKIIDEGYTNLIF